ncbi:heterokaryon incompatibility protein-domain-containing protein [Microdochium bolleyi]|uniref:Heterokaryon incompatibility protein-domain-containing protein n=1 Tax=Microdochium bolleyi TaxID=196109 RepID=A0A136IS53_9PEZI|nr:heterokaryon incompatibility protein-domain-containing protein [Microdochium bolleyi]
MTRLYTYKPLSPGCHTRVLELLPSPNPRDELRGSLKDIDIYQNFDYQALSYTWGNEPFAQRIVLGQDGSCLKIKPNLYDALVRFRDRHRVVKIWIDALCINQEDNQEKARQIPIMDQIYSVARAVWVWLGNYPQAAQQLEAINSASRRLDIPGIESSVYPAVRDVVKLPWFSRRWIVQEVVLNDEVHVFCGSTASMDWTRLVGVVLHICKTKPSWEGLGCIYMMALLAEERRDRRRGVSTPRRGILEILRSFSSLGCAVDHDRIYALAGVSADVAVGAASQQQRNQVSDTVIPVEYSKSVEHVYIDFAASRLKALAGFEHILQITAQRSNGTHLRGQCSWVPDWRLPPVRHELTGGIVLTRRNAKVDQTTGQLRIDFTQGGSPQYGFEGYIKYSSVMETLDTFPPNASDGGIAAWTRKMWDHLKKSRCVALGMPTLSDFESTSLLTQFERLVTEDPRSPWIQLKNGVWLDAFRNSAEFRRMVLGDQRGVYVPPTSPDLFRDIRRVMTGRRLLLAAVMSPDPRQRAVSNATSKISSLLSGKQQRPSAPQRKDPASVPSSSWPVIAIGPSDTQTNDVLCAPSKVEVQCIPNDPGAQSYSYYEHLGQASCILRPRGSASMASSSSCPQFWYIGEVKSYRLYDPRWSGKYDQRIQERAIAQHQHKLTSIVLC